MATTTKRALTFPQEVAVRLEEKEWSLRQLARATQEDSGWGALSTIHEILSGHRRATMQAMENIAHAMHLPPESFLEYQLGLARRNLDPEVVGIEAAAAYAGRHGIID